MLLCALFPCAASSAGASAAGVDILSSSSFQSSGYLYIVGEVRNNTASNVRFVKISAIYYDGVGGVLGTDFSYARLDILTPGQISPFTVFHETPPGYASYTLAVEYSTTAVAALPQLAILDTREWVDSSNDLWLVGEVQNNTASTLQFVKILLTLYNNAGVVINNDYGYGYYDLLLPGQKSPFKLLVLSGPVDYITRRLSTQASVTTDVPPNLRSMNITHYTDGLGWLHFSGQVQNLGSTSVQYEEAFLTLYDAKGKILNCDRDYLTPTTLPAGGTGVFEFILFNHFEGWTTYSIYPPESVAQPTATPTQTTMPSPTATPTRTATRTATGSPTSTTPGLTTPTATTTPSRTPTVSPSATATLVPPTATATPPGDLLLTGQVYDAALGPSTGISGATVAISFCFPASLQTTSAAGGSYSLLLPALYLNQCSSLTLEGHAPGYATLSLPVTVADLRAQPARDLALVPAQTPSPTATFMPPAWRAYIPCTVRQSPE